MTNVNNHIDEFLDYYYSFGASPEYAVLIKGAWGTGKSWFIQNTLKRLEEKGGKYLYVSLYGVTSYSEIEDSFFQQLHPVLSSKGMTLASKVFKGILKTTIKVDLDADGKPDGSVSSQIPDIEMPDYLTNTDGYVLVFDDLERCSMNIVDVLGYINHFVEHQGYKVILISNEDEILNHEEYKESYPRIKEKLIGKTLEVTPDIDAALSHFIENSGSEKAKELYSLNSSQIKNLYSYSKYKNLRHLKQSLWDFERTFRELPETAHDKEGLVLSLLCLHLAYSFEIKSGTLSTQDIKGIKESFWSGIFDKDENK